MVMLVEQISLYLGKVLIRLVYLNLQVFPNREECKLSFKPKTKVFKLILLVSIFFYVKKDEFILVSCD